MQVRISGFGFNTLGYQVVAYMVFQMLSHSKEALLIILQRDSNRVLCINNPDF